MFSQNRMAAVEEQRADLGLQISLLGEHEITKLLLLVTEIARRMGIPAAADPELSELSRPVSPDKMLDRIEQPLSDPDERPDTAVSPPPRI